MEVPQESINVLRMSLRALASWVEDIAEKIVLSMNHKSDCGYFKEAGYLK